ncbi:50S ribosomal protein L31e [Candidatus Woesearchaeota archaeon]|nr:50S ribosomal protein L31e [Candidatus Woesearchaeota archaeon]
MAKKEKKPEITLERVYNVPLRKEWLKVPKYKRAKKAGKAMKEFLAKHMKTDIENVKIEKYANLKIWERGIKSPPHHIKIIAKKDSTGIVRAELEGAPVEEKKMPEKKAKKAEEKKPEAKEISPEEKPKISEEKVEEKKPSPEEEKKPEIKSEAEKEEPKPMEEKPKAEIKKTAEESKTNGQTAI